MTMQRPFPAATSSRLPDGVTIQPREFDWHDLESVPQYWFAGNAIISHLENAFSILIPPGERFFIRSVRHYEDRAKDPELGDLIRAFIQQEALHTRAHNQFNASLRKFGVDVDQEIAYAERFITAMGKYLPKKMQLAATVFLEHLTATGAHVLFSVPEVAETMHPAMLRFWRWHAVEELEHKSVAFDLYQQVGGGYLLRVFSAIATILLLARPFDKIARRMIKADPNQITDEMRQQAREINRKVMGPQLRMIGQYFKPGFHPWKCKDEKYLAEWYASAEGA
ncbi:MAG: metal-dependent hydrolase [Deltaproteobacteria bacterium]|nr:metal-dependent hydrolase [Deltaproteobacteria bacterium]